MCLWPPAREQYLLRVCRSYYDNIVTWIVRLYYCKENDRRVQMICIYYNIIWVYTVAHWELRNPCVYENTNYYCEIRRVCNTRVHGSVFTCVMHVIVMLMRKNIWNYRISVTRCVHSETHDRDFGCSVLYYRHAVHLNTTRSAAGVPIILEEFDQMFLFYFFEKKLGFKL